MEERYYIGVDIGEGKDYSVVTLFENGEYRPIQFIDSISLDGDVERRGYVGVEAGELTFSTKIVGVDDYALRELFDLDFVRDMANALFSYCVDTCGKRRKTTYKTVRRDCAKRNRRK